MKVILHCEIHECIYFILGKEELPQQWKGSVFVLVYTKGEIAVVLIN